MTFDLDPASNTGLAVRDLTRLGTVMLAGTPGPNLPVILDIDGDGFDDGEREFDAVGHFTSTGVPLVEGANAIRVHATNAKGTSSPRAPLTRTPGRRRPRSSARLPARSSRPWAARWTSSGPTTAARGRTRRPSMLAMSRSPGVGDAGASPRQRARALHVRGDSARPGRRHVCRRAGGRPRREPVGAGLAVVHAPALRGASPNRRRGFFRGDRRHAPDGGVAWRPEQRHRAVRRAALRAPGDGAGPRDAVAECRRGVHLHGRGGVLGRGLGADAAGVGWYVDFPPRRLRLCLFDSLAATASAGPDCSNASGKYDLYAVMLHEIGHIPGFSKSDRGFTAHWAATCFSREFVGPAFTVALTSDGGHLDPASYPFDLMDPALVDSTRELPSALDGLIVQAAWASGGDDPAALPRTIDAKSDPANVASAPATSAAPSPRPPRRRPPPRL